MPFEPINRSQVVDALQEFGPMTRYELAEHLGWPAAKVGTTIGSTRWLLPEKVFRIVGYKPVTGFRGRDVAIYAAQAGPDIARKPIDKVKRRRVSQARYREKNRAVISTRDRIARAAKAGRQTVVNPFLMLAPPAVRSAMTQRRVNAQA